MGIDGRTAASPAPTRNLASVAAIQYHEMLSRPPALAGIMH